MQVRNEGQGRRWLRAGGLAALLLGLGLTAWSIQATAARPPTGAVAHQTGQAGIVGPIVIQAERHDISPPIRDLYEVSTPPRGQAEREIHHRKPWMSAIQDVDSVVQRTLGLPHIPSPLQSFDGINFATSSCSCAPPDTDGEVGPNHFVQITNSAYAVYSKTGTVIQAPRAINTIWSGFGGACQTRNDGDPIVKYDQMADRWVISQFTFAAPFYECIAVSTSGDPTGSYARYAFLESNTILGDYPKIGVWPDGYYMTTNEFTLPNTWMGAGNYAFDRSRMLAGLSATAVYFHLPTSDWGGAEPSDLDGAALPPANAPNLFVEVDDAAWDPPNIPTDQIQMWRFHVDFSGGGSTFTALTPIVPPELAAFDGLLCNFASCVPQPGTVDKLDTLADRTMYRVAYRNMGDHEAVVFNHTVDVGTDVAGVRWYELRSVSFGTPSIFQQGTYAPGSPTIHNWMGSMAMDQSGDIALGYSDSSGTTTFPSVRYTGRLVGDPAGTLPQGEGTFVNGTGSQLQTNGRWGDYSAMTVDPTDDCTFWFTSEYYAVTGAFSWSTRIGSFKFPSCGAVATPTVPPQPTNTVPPQPTNTQPPQPTNTQPPGPTATPGGCTVPFSDTTGTPFETFIRCLYCRGIINGYGDNTFRPNATLTRGQLSKMEALAAGYGDPIPSTQQTFEDVPPSQPFWHFIEQLSLHVAISGYTCGGPGEPCNPPGNRPYFRPNAPITRSQTAKVDSIVAGYSDAIASTTQTFEDTPHSNPFWVFIERIYLHGQIISGYTCGGPGEPCNPPGNRSYFRPYNNVTRGQASKIVANTFYPNCVTPQRSR